ncbi:signal transduction histidine kinase [Mycobacterium sp. OAS707]|nr:histidine kinase [Mycobacterium sp. OAS707]MBE1546918.1 signal transduction histidine kinase [Mycobacterium sp. OAS707]
MMYGGHESFYDGTMLGAVMRHVRDTLRKRGELIPLGYNWPFVIAIDVTLVTTVVIATLQRPAADLLVALLGVTVALFPFALFFVFGVKWVADVVGIAWTASAAILLFATATPVPTDFAPLILALMIGEVGAISTAVAGFIATASATALLLLASALDRLDSVALYLGIVGMAWLVGYLMRTQQQLLLEQQQAQAQLAEHAAADERRRIAREVHDVIAHSLSVTLLHVTGARRGLQQDRDVDDAVEALEQAEQLGRQAMSDIRRTVGLLDGAPMKLAPEPTVADISGLVDDFVRAGLAIDLDIDGRLDRVSAAIGLALYRITQESLANIAKHSPDSRSTVRLAIARASATLTIANRLPAPVVATSACEGRGLRGMRQRVELLGGTIDIGPSDDGWLVRADIPLPDADSVHFPPWCTR